MMQQQAGQQTEQVQFASEEIGTPEVIHFLAGQIDSFKQVRGFDKSDNRLGNLKAHLVSAGHPAPASIPQCVEALPTLGCVAFDYHGGKLSMICFKDGKVFHLITADKSLIGTELPTEAQIFEIRNQAFKSWQDEEQVYILGVEGSEADIPEFI